MKLLIALTVLLAFAQGCASSVKGALSEACTQQCRKNYQDAQALRDCIYQCQGPKS